LGRKEGGPGKRKKWSGGGIREKKREREREKEKRLGQFLGWAESKGKGREKKRKYFLK